MAETTTIRLPPRLRARVRAVAKETDRSAHAVILEAIERYTAYEEQLRALVGEARVADEAIERGAAVYRADDVHAWLDRLAADPRAARPKPWRR